MAHVHADPERLKQLARDFQSSSQQCEQIARQLQRSLDRTDWDDDERRKFQDSLKETLRMLSRVSEQFRSYYPMVLQKKVAALEQFRR
jgi:DNA repair ATPase RecN